MEDIHSYFMAVRRDLKSFISKFSSKKDAITAISMAITMVYKSKIPYRADILVLLDDIRYCIDTYDDRDLAQQALDFWNETTGQQRRDYGKISAVIRQIPKLTLDQVQSVIVHKQLTWGNDPIMKEYLRPATIFGSRQKFINYLEDARQYWITEMKKNGQESA